MPQGLQIWDTSGVVVLDLTDRAGIVAGSFQTNSQNGSLTVQGLDDSTGVFFFSTQARIPGANARHLIVTSAGKTIFWNYVAYNSLQTVNENATIYYGAY